MGCGEFIVKYVLFFSNLFFSLSGLALVGVGIAVQLKVSAVTDILQDYNLAIAPVSAMVVGGVVFLIAFFGCCGAIKESNCMLVTYSIFMLVLMALKIALATLIFVNLGSLLQEIPKIMNESFAKDQKTFQQTVEYTFSCCGPNGPLSYGVLLTLPDTCCAVPTCTVGNAYGGCSDKVIDFTSTFGNLIALGAIVIGAIEVSNTVNLITCIIIGEVYP
ncbi:tetraspanin family domain-containing protein [Phthorimaea operculella]|nr:tetraspanin family domain-containing protein [Phthorimaea operculella]